MEHRRSAAGCRAAGDAEGDRGQERRALRSGRRGLRATSGHRVRRGPGIRGRRPRRGIPCSRHDHARSVGEWGVRRSVSQHGGAAPAGLERWFDLIGAVSRLREIRALAGFTRIQPLPVSADRIIEELANGRISPLSTQPPTWLPGADIRGEGIFLRFRADAVRNWIGQNPAVTDRARVLDEQHREFAARRGYEVEYPITPRLLLVHSFAHALIRQLAVDCGYSSSALRERLYVAEPNEDRDTMQGVLVYTGSPDSEGSLGGLVRLAEPVQLEAIVRRTVRALQWCPNDPVCSETDPAATGELVSGAACHSCLLVPETACEKFNRELDRMVLVGPPQGGWKGFFDGLEEPGA
ncbi:MAG: DUF1998 domain-containing protein [Steroidobacteraceae bacterium]